MSTTTDLKRLIASAALAIVLAPLTWLAFAQTPASSPAPASRPTRPLTAPPPTRSTAPAPANPLAAPIPYIGKSGAVLFVPPGSAAPILTVNGTAATLTAGPTQAGVKAAFDAYAITPVVLPGDTATLTLGGKAASPPLTNFSGRMEYPLPAPTLRVGMNMGAPQLPPQQTYCSARNWATRIAAWTPAPLAVDGFGLPTKTAGKTVGICLNLTLPNNIDKTRLPNLVGTYTLVYDALDPATVVTLEGVGGTPCVAVPGQSSPGSATGIGIVKAYAVAVAPGTQCAGLQVAITHPANTPSLANLWVIPPGNPIDRSDPLAGEASVLDRIRIGPGNQGPSCLRWMDAINFWGGASNCTNPGDQPGIASASWLPPTKTLTATITAIRPLTAPGTVVLPTGGMRGTPPGGSLPYADASAWQFGTRGVAEFVTAAPHGFATGQTATLAAPATFTGTAGGVTVSWGNGSSLYVFVTSANTFVCPFYNANLPTPAAGLTLDGPVTLPAAGPVTASVAIPGGPVLPIEFAARFTSYFRDCYFWVNFPLSGSDAMAAEWAKRIAPYLGPTNKIILEISDETWNFAFPQQSFNWTLSRLTPGLIGHGNLALWSAKRTLQVANIFRANLGPRHNDVVSLVCWQFGSAGTYLQDCLTANLIPDAIGTALYFGPPHTWGAAMANWTPAQQHDVARAYLATGYTAQLADFTNGVAAVEAATGRRLLRVAYEFGLDDGPFVSSGPIVSSNFYAHPDLYQSELMSYAVSQAAGFDVVACYSFAISMGADGTNYGYYGYQGQNPGTGDGSDGRPANGTVGTTWLPSVSPRGLAWQRWQAAALANQGR